MSEPGFPSPEELQRRLQSLFQSALRTGETAPAASGDVDPDPGDAPAPLPDFPWTPREIKAHLDRFVIRQDEAKKVLAVAVCDHYHHVRADRELRRHGGEVPEYAKQNVLLTGPTGVGKTYLVRHIADFIGVPFVRADATKFSETGYVGGDVEDLVRELVQKADGDLDLAAQGIIYLDEIDKIAAAHGLTGRDVSGRGVQVALLKLMEETEVPLRNPMDLASQMQAAIDVQRHGKARRDTINTRNILFIVSGAFPRLRGIVERRRRDARIGFAAAAAPSAEIPWETDVRTADFVEFGLEPEFVGRLPVRVACGELSADDLFTIVTRSEGSIIRQYERSFRAHGIEVSFDQAALRRIAAMAAAEGTGARGLLTVCERLLREFKFELPGSGVRALEVNEALVEDPAGTLTALMAEGQEERVRAQREAVGTFAAQFQAAHGLVLEFPEDAVQALVSLAGERGCPVHELCAGLFKDYEFGLRLVQRNTGSSRVVLPVRAVHEPDRFLSDLVVESYRRVQGES